MKTNVGTTRPLFRAILEARSFHSYPLACKLTENPGFRAGVAPPFYYFGYPAKKCEEIRKINDSKITVNNSQRNNLTRQ